MEMQICNHQQESMNKQKNADFMILGPYFAKDYETSLAKLLFL